MQDYANNSLQFSLCSALIALWELTVKQKYSFVSNNSFWICYGLFNIKVFLYVLSVTGKPFFIVSSFAHRWLFGWQGCRYYGWAGFFFGCGSLITMTVVSLDRYLKICHLQYGNYN